MIKTEKKSVTLLGILLRLLGLVTISIDIILFIVRPVCLIFITLTTPLVYLISFLIKGDTTYVFNLNKFADLNIDIAEAATPEDLIPLTKRLSKWVDSIERRLNEN
jgi:hypothetical protein